MSDGALPARAQTIKQAKAAFKSRGRPTLTEREQKQLQRAAELDERARRTREAEKKKADANKKKLEREKRESEEQARLQLATQRRRDKFGHECSQMHLGPFFSKKADTTDKQDANSAVTMNVPSDDSFGDSDLDDETLLQAMEGLQQKKAAAAPDQKIPPPQNEPLAHAPPVAKPTSRVPLAENFACFLDDLDSSTQIARELAEDERTGADRSGSSKASSFYDDFDLTVEDIEEVEARKPVQAAVARDQALMPPPPLPIKVSTPAPQPVTRPISKPNFDHGFTMQELEDLVADDIQLTQAEPD